MDYQVSVQVAGDDIACGTLYVGARRGVESATFTYDEGYLSRVDAFALCPDLPLAPGPAHVTGMLFGAFEDCMPDRWGRNLMLRAERRNAREEGRVPRSFHEGDYLVGVGDLTRQGALRIWRDGVAVASSDEGVPREIDLPHLLSQADLAAQDMDADVRDLLLAGSSLGGARPKASMMGESGNLCIAKFPKADESSLQDTCAWEHVALVLAGRCGIETPRSRLIRIGSRSVLLLRRFDRDGSARIPYLSGLSAIQGTDGNDYSYLELVDFIEREGARPTSDIRQLWLRILFSCAIGNTDDHMRNHAFLRGREGWHLSPAFDVNPTEGEHEKYLSCAIDFDERLAAPAAAIDLCGLFRMGREDARRAAGEMASVLGSWRRVALGDGISKASVERMAGCFESGIERLRAIR